MKEKKKSQNNNLNYHHSVQLLNLSSSLQPHGLQHDRLLCTAPTPRACWNSCLSSWWSHPTISSSVFPFFFCIQFPSIRVFSNESVLCIRWLKHWSFSFSISPSNEYSGLISLRIDGLDLPIVQGTLKSLLLHHSSKTSIHQCSAFFIVQLSHPYMTIRKTIVLKTTTIRNFLKKHKSNPIASRK